MSRRVPSIARAVSLGIVRVAVLAAGASAASAQCLNWETFPHTPSENPQASAAVEFDDGSGVALYVAYHDGSAWGVKRWDGTNMTAVGALISGGTSTNEINALAVYEVGGFASLYMAGRMHLDSGDAIVARWNGSVWERIADGWHSVQTMIVHDDGSGPALYAAGDFSIPGLTSPNIARWDGTSWSAVGGGIGGNGVYDLAVHDEGTGPRLFASGRFTSAGGQPIAGVARWDGTSFTAVGAGFPAGSVVFGLASYDDAGVPALAAAGNFTSAGGAPAPGIASWRAGSWSALADPTVSPFGNVDRVTVADTGTGPALHVLVTDPVTDFVKRWDGAAWTQIGSELTRECGPMFIPDSWIFRPLDLGAGPELCVAGFLQSSSGGVAEPFLRYDGQDWKPAFPAAIGFEPYQSVSAFASFDDGSGPALYVAGNFCSMGSVAALGVVRRRAGTWEGVDLATNVTALGIGDLGSGPELYALGPFQYNTPVFGRGVVRWTGSGWSGLGTGLGSGFEAGLVVHSADVGSGPRLYMGGAFTTAGGVHSPNLAAWNGSNWIPVGSGLNGQVRALAAFDGGGGTKLYAGGTFAQNVVRWNGTTFDYFGSGMNDHVWALRVFDDGSGSKLYAAGAFTSAGGVSVQRVARYDGTSWSALGAGFDALVTTLEVFDDGSGPALYAAGDFSNSGTTPIAHVARWNGSSWSALGNGVASSVSALASHSDGPGEPAKLYVGGTLQTAGTLATSNLAAWRGCGGEIERFCFGDGTTSPCPCGNSGIAFRGCNNSANSLGARMNATGAANPDTITLYVAGETPSAATLVFQGDVLLSNPIPFGDGLRCVGGSLKRLYTTNAVSGSLAVPGVGQPSLSVRSAQLGDALAPGDVRGYQAWYRDVNPSFCAPPAGANWNLSNAVRIAW